MVSIETRSSWVVAFVALGILATSCGAPYIAVVALKDIAAEMGGARSVPALGYSMFWFGSGLGGILMGRLAERFGVRWTVMLGGAMITAGLVLSCLGHEVWQFYIGHGVLMGLLGNGGINAPLYIYVSRWFDRHRGTALALISSGTYIGGAIWPPVFERLIANFGWRQTMLTFSVVAIGMIVPLAAIFLRRPPEFPAAGTAGAGPLAGGRVLGWPPNLVFAILAPAGFMCCVPMAMPQGHLVALCTDIGITASHGAAMVSVLLGTAFISRQAWGWISDRIGGLRTIFVGSLWQTGSMIALLLTQDEVGLFTVAALFGFGFSGIIPAYVLTLRELYPASEASWRVPTMLFFSGAGMAFGGWLAGALYDYFGYYAPALAAGVAFNVLNLLGIGLLVLRQGALRPIARHA
jgi:MFS family permease